MITITAIDTKTKFKGVYKFNPDIRLAKLDYPGKPRPFGHSIKEQQKTAKELLKYAEQCKKIDARFYKEVSKEAVQVTIRRLASLLPSTCQITILDDSQVYEPLAFSKKEMREIIS